MKRIFSLVCALVLALTMIPLPARAADSSLKQDIKSAVSSQIQAFAASINQSDAVNTAAKALAKHGLSQGGKKLSVGKSHALTAALMNTQMLQAALTDSCSQAIYLMQRSCSFETWYARGSCSWYENSSSYSAARCASDYSQGSSDVSLASNTNYTSPRNSYDAAMDWIAGSTYLRLEIAWVKTNAQTMDYQVTCMVWDKFDFDTVSNSGFKNFMSSLGAVMFREFTWESKVTFTLSVPHACGHRANAYSWSYNPDSRTFQSITGQGFSSNPVTAFPTGSDSFFHGLENTVYLRSDQPWVLEYDTGDHRNRTTLSPFPETHYDTAELWLAGGKYITILERRQREVSDAFVAEYNLTTNIQLEHFYYGSYYGGIFSPSSGCIYTYRLENQVRNDGSNMIWLTILERDTGKLVVDPVPMDSFYHFQSWLRNDPNHSKPQDWTEGQGRIGGKDLCINYIGTRKYAFQETSFDLRIWESGKDESAQSTCTEVVTAPTCTAKGYTTYTCTSCGYTYKGSYTPATGHIWSGWEAVSPTLYERKCTGCGEKEQETRLLPGDANGDGTVNALDLIILRQYLAGWEVTIHCADCNSDGTVNALDLIRLRQYLAGWEVTLTG